jgi:hypothetical protein
MRVVFKGPKVLYDYLVDSFWYAKECDVWNMATLTEEEDSIKYRTCCGNLWFAKKEGDSTIFGYEGTRQGAIRLQPFFDKLMWVSHDPPQLGYVEEKEERDEGTLYIDGETGERICQKCIDLKKVKVFRLEVVEHRTTTPKEWGLEWYHQVERVKERVGDMVREDIVVMDGRYPIKVIPGTPRKVEEGQR